MASINWNDGQLITITEGDTATCDGGLNSGQLYALFFYNSAGNDADATVTVVGNNADEPVSVTVPGTTGNEGLAGLCFVSGDDTNTVSASISGDQPGVELQAFIGSVKMPTDTSGINNWELQANGSPQPFEKFTRYYDVPSSTWYSVTVESNINTFISVQFQENAATVIAVNSGDSISNVIAYYGTSAEPNVTIFTESLQSYSWNVMGNGTQWVWINADSVQDSESATITLQQL